MDIEKIRANTMLLTAIEVYNRLYPIICNLSKKKQLDIVNESTMIAYDARIKAFDIWLIINLIYK